jgi:hypothetical protein
MTTTRHSWHSFFYLCLNSQGRKKNKENNKKVDKEIKNSCANRATLAVPFIWIGLVICRRRYAWP